MAYDAQSSMKRLAFLPDHLLTCDFPPHLVNSTRRSAKELQIELPSADLGRPWDIFVKTPPKSRMAFSLVSLFAGCGGFDLGFRQAGLRTTWANDVDSDACQTFESNLGSKIVCGDINSISLPDLAPDVLTAGFPCQAFSNAGSRKGTKDKRGTLYQAALRCIRSFQPKVIVLENVRGLLSMKNGKHLLIQEICEELWNCGYRPVFRLVDASNHRVPQRRLRLLVVGLRRDLFAGVFRFPYGMAKGGLNLGATLEELPDSVANQQELMPLNPQALRIGAMVPEGGSWKDIPYARLPSRLRRVRENIARYRWPNFYRRFHRDEIPGTITAAFKPENAGVWHPLKKRVLSVREAARIQSFPDWFQFHGRSVKSKYQQIGNAVPPRLAYELAIAIRSTLAEGAGHASNGYVSLAEFLKSGRPLRPADHGVVYENA